ncbi:MAG TPA: hypothetical protein PKM59_02290 [Thermodesulfobacteriota bacterium]|nr:hypothetical protein [Thermodesulfobacteriota bacterium]HNU70527.1 hypothetical protein [Thermodesulfobacteriota bacterium]
MGIFGTKQEKIATAVRMGERGSITCSSIWQQRIDGQEEQGNPKRQRKHCPGNRTSGK